MTTVVGIENDTVIVGDSTKHGGLGDSGGRVDAFLPFIDTYAPPSGGPDAGPGGGGGPDAGTDEPTEDGGCSAGSGAGLVIVLAFVGAPRRRRRRS